MRENEREKLVRMTQTERSLWARGIGRIAGIDEVGRGPLAGPVVSACVVLSPKCLIEGVDDSKKLSEKRREALFDRIMGCADYARTASLPPGEIDRINILNATRRTMELAARDAQGAYFLIDAVKGLALPGGSLAIVHGDAVSYMIAAASIVAKVTRDRYMEQLHEQYPEYNFLSNKGYGTKEHIRALREFGPCPEHRHSFIQKILLEGGDESSQAGGAR